jgi:translation initiation factor IF-3
LRRRKRSKPKKQELRANHRIRIPELQVVDETGKQLGVMRTSDALRMARERDLDLVEVSPYEKPPIAKFMDYGKYKYQKSKEVKEAKAQGKGFKQETKAVRVGFKTGEHDMAFKARKADDFLQQGHIVKVELTLRGREKAYAQVGRQKLLDFIKRLETPTMSQNEPQRGPYGWVQMVQRDKKVPLKKKEENGKESKEQESAPEAHQDNGNGKNPEA